MQKLNTYNASNLKSLMAESLVTDIKMIPIIGPK